MATITRFAVETILHAEHEHPNALRLAATGVLPFVAGVCAYGSVGRSLRNRFGTGD